MNTKIASLFATVALVVGATVSYAAPVNATILDFNQSSPNYFGGGPFGAGLEDNETEPGTTSSQLWDMEAFVVNGSKLYIVGGYNMQAGQAGGGGSVVPGMLAPGDLFIKIGGAQPGASPTTYGSGNVNNAGYGYSYAIDLTQPVGATGASANVYGLNAASVFNTVVYDQFGANPWKYLSGATSTSSTAISYDANNANGNADLVALGLGGLVGGMHHILEVDLGFLVGNVAAGTNVWFSYTMECGNDSLKGKYDGGFDQVPDSATSALLMGLGLASLSLVAFKRRRA